MPRLSLLAGCWLTAAGLLIWAGPALANHAEQNVLWHVNKSWRLSRPVRTARDAVNVTIGLSDVTVEDSAVIEPSPIIRGRLMVKWTDHRLAWTDDSTAQDVRAVRVKLTSSIAWTPSIQVLNAFDNKPSLFPPVTECVVSRDGEVLAMVPVQFQVKCRRVHGPEAAQYVGSSGYDPAAVCSFTFGSVLTSMDLLDLRPMMNETNFASVRFGKVTAERKEISRDWCSTPFAALEVTLSLFS